MLVTNSGDKLNRTVLIVFAPVLMLTGILGFVLPADMSLTSGAPAYNIFHILFGVIGLIFALSKKASLIRRFNIAFGLIDLYQALASYVHLFPESYFRWTKADDVLHIVIGLGLVLVGFAYGRRDEG